MLHPLIHEALATEHRRDLLASAGRAPARRHHGRFLPRLASASRRARPAGRGLGR